MDQRISMHSPKPRSLSRSVSTHSVTVQQRPESRGSTGSLPSVAPGNAFQPSQHHFPSDHVSAHARRGSYMTDGAVHASPTEPPTEAAAQQISGYHSHPGDMHPAQMAGMPHNMAIGPDMRPMSQQGFHHPQYYPMQHHQPQMQHFNMPPQHIQHGRHLSEHYEGSPAPDDSGTEQGKSKKRKSTTTSAANEQELRKLLNLHNGRNLKDIATEIQRAEGGGKSEKVKQVFAMLWLQESCTRSSESVRRDRVFARYTERCANERVPTLNPASFGKLVRIIFPDVQTRRLGVRGESKYHYVDLSLINDSNDPDWEATLDRPDTSASWLPDRPRSTSLQRPLNIDTRPPALQRPSTRTTLETADFPPRSANIVHRTNLDSPAGPAEPKATKLDCTYINTPVIRIEAKSAALVRELPALRPNMPATISTYLAMPTADTLASITPSMQQNPIELPYIADYIGDVTHDCFARETMCNLYRSYCIDLVDAFRKCKDKLFFSHQTAIVGKMTVPVQKIFNMPQVAPWIQECDMRMYKHILRYFGSMVLQKVPDGVWQIFDRISVKLIPHLYQCFEEKCAAHVLAAKLVPATRFLALVKKLRVAQTATLRIDESLDNPDVRTQMWLDVCSICDPDQIVESSNPPPEIITKVRGMLKHDLRALLAPSNIDIVKAAEEDPDSPFAKFLHDGSHFDGIMSDTASQANDMLSRLIEWMLALPRTFDGHHPQCMLDWFTRLFNNIQCQMSMTFCASQQAWLYLNSFATNVLGFMCMVEGFWLPVEEQKRLDGGDNDKKAQQQQLNLTTRTREDPTIGQGSFGSGSKRKRANTDVGGDERTLSPSPMRPHTAGGDTEPESTTSAHFPILPPNHQTNTTGDDDDDMDALNEGGDLVLPKTGFTSPMKAPHDAELAHFRTGLTSPVKPGHDDATHPGLHDDSGIDLGFGNDADILEGEKEARQIQQRDWGLNFHLSSDPPEAAMAQATR